MAELADALDLGSSGRPCRFKSCYPHGRSALNRALLLFCVIFRVAYIREMVVDNMVKRF